MAQTLTAADDQRTVVLDSSEVPIETGGSTGRSETNHESLLRRQMPELDSIRGIAILAVVIYHGFYWQVDLAAFPRWQQILLTLAWPGRLGVNLFFVLSGFLITGLLLESKTKQDYYKRFYIRRARRILPAYMALLCALAAVHYAPPSFLVLSLAYLSNVTPLFGVAIAYPVLWSLAVEEHFYFVWPAIVRRLSIRGILALSIAVIAVSPLLRFISAHFSSGFEFNDYTWNSLDGMACGAVLAVLLRIWKDDRRKLLQLVVALCGAAMILSPFAVQTRQSALGAALQVVPWHLFFTAVLGGFLLIGSSNWKSLVQSPFLRFFGYISYGLYLVHVLLFSAFDHFVAWHGLSGLTVRFVCAAGLSTLAAWLSRRYLEDPFLGIAYKPQSSRADSASGLRAGRDLSAGTA